MSKKNKNVPPSPSKGDNRTIRKKQGVGLSCRCGLLFERGPRNLPSRWHFYSVPCSLSPLFSPVVGAISLLRLFAAPLDPAFVCQGDPTLLAALFVLCRRLLVALGEMDLSSWTHFRITGNRKLSRLCRPVSPPPLCRCPSARPPELGRHPPLGKPVLRRTHPCFDS